MLNKFIRKLRRNIFLWVQKQPEWWVNNIPPANFVYEKEDIVKEDIKYWQQAAQVLNNGAFIREMRKVQDYYISLIDDMLAFEEDYHKIHNLRLELQGIRKVADVMRKCHNKYIELKKEADYGS